MKYAMWFIAFMIFGGENLIAQTNKEQRIQDSVIGWDAKNRYDKLKVPADEAGKQKLAIINKMAEWLKASYTPVGSIGEYQRFIGVNNYGLNFQAWNVNYNNLDEQKHFIPVAEENIRAQFTVNRVYGASPISFMSKNKEWFFTMQPDGYSPNSTQKDKRAGLQKNIDPNVSKFPTWVNEWITVYIAPDNKLPMQPVTKEQLLDKAAASLDGVFEDKKKEEVSRWKENEKGLSQAIERDKKEIDIVRNNIRLLKEKYKNSLQEPAEVVDMQVDWRSFTIDTWDIFKGAPNTVYFPVYTFDAPTVEKMKSAKPLFLAVAVPYANKNMGNRDYELYTSAIQNINYEYIYNYFFGTEKPTKSYTPANEEKRRERLSAYKSGNAANNNNAKKKSITLASGVVLFDDFSGETIGNKPAGWYSGNYGKAAVIANVAGMEGNWMKLGDNEITSTDLKILPKDFLLEFDLATDKFEAPWGAGIELNLSGKNKGSDGIDYASEINIRLNAGLQAAADEAHNYRGELKIKLLNSPSKMGFNDKGGYFTFAQPQFTSSKRKVNVKLEKINGNLNVYLNEAKVANSSTFKSLYGKDCGDCNIPSAVQYDKFTIRNATNDPANIGSYISNIKITKK